MNCNTERRNVKARETHYLKQRVEDVAQQLAKRRHCAHAAQVTEEARNLNGPAYTALACAGEPRAGRPNQAGSAQLVSSNNITATQPPRTGE